MSWQHQEITRKIISAAIEVHKSLGPGLLETAYQTCLAAEFGIRSIKYQREVLVPLEYKGQKLDCGFRVDFLVENSVILELKSVDGLLPFHESQVLTYLRFMDKQVGLLMNFNEAVLKNGIRRFALGSKHEEDSLTPGRVPVDL